jgi:hypothetical protein
MPCKTNPLPLVKTRIRAGLHSSLEIHSTICKLHWGLRTLKEFRTFRFQKLSFPRSTSQCQLRLPKALKSELSQRSHPIPHLRHLASKSHPLHAETSERCGFVYRLVHFQGRIFMAFQAQNALIGEC